mgnify:CR=1 FL=1
MKLDLGMCVIGYTDIVQMIFQSKEIKGHPENHKNMKHVIFIEPEVVVRIKISAHSEAKPCEITDIDNNK